MQKLNAREYFVIVVMSLVTIVIAILLGRELFSETSPFVTTASGELSTRSTYILNIGQNLVQLTLGIIAVYYLIKRRRAGWIAAFALLIFYGFIAFYAVGKPLLSGLFDVLIIAGLTICLLFLLSLIFLCIPSTLKKFNITRSVIIPLVLILGLLVTFNFLIPAS